MRTSLLRKSLKIGGLLLAVLLSLVLVFFLYVYAYSPGETRPITDSAGRPLPRSIASLEPVTLNGNTQWILLRGQDSTKPVLLFLHGGPGSPEMPMLTGHTELEKRFVVVNWDQRGSGKSFDERVFDASFTTRTFIEDAASLSRKLARRFGQDKIYLMGHSWGSFLGLLTVQRYPELFHAYYGIGQVANQLEGEQLSYDWVLAQARKDGSQRAVEVLTGFGRPQRWPDEKWVEYLGRQRSLVVSYGGAMLQGSISALFAKTLIHCREYTLSDKLNYPRGALKSLERLWAEVVSVDFNRAVPEVAVPVYIFQGRHDYQTPYAVARRYFERLRAPQKAFFTFENSAHMLLFEEPDRFIQCLDSTLAAPEATARLR
ncbi:alpha/beta fold hydrolase [Tellurirhabdus rosea]|uniref:alpha/beta fold hydrolase n=1 Tax=Tellurirhabdus rosea TaxID=2674997 RepID=UPI002257B2AB|nr:alpha/beta hydrolase [Tellurirhabdus rosea]